MGTSFNASHSDGLAVVAVARGRRIGVDIELVRHLDDAMDVAAGQFTEREIGWLRASPQSSYSEAFLALWTRKESYVKAVGGGLSIPLDSFDCSTVGDGGVGRPQDASGVLPYAFIELDGPDGFVGAITVEGTRVTIGHMETAAVAI